MPSDNHISINLPPAVITTVLGHLASIKTALAPYTVNVPDEDKKDIPTIGPERAAMVQVFRDQMAAHPTWIPQFISMSEVGLDDAAHTSYGTVYPHVAEILEMILDPMHLLGADLLRAYLAFYGNVQFLAKHNTPGADTTVNILKPYVSTRGGGTGGGGTTPPTP